MKKSLLKILLISIILMTWQADIVNARHCDLGKFTNIACDVGKVKSKKAEKPFSMVWFTDTQYYAQSYPEIYDLLGDWLVAEHKKGTFGYVINTGDLVNNASDTDQWETASRNLKKLDDANIPYGILAGNHDVSMHGLNYDMFCKYFGVARYKNRPWYGGCMENNLNHYDLVSFGTHKFVILYLGYNTKLTEETIAWSNKVLKMNSDKNAIIATHEYLNSNSTLTEMAKAVFNKIVVKNDNVIIVLCGHNHGVARNIKKVTNSNGSNRKVLEILSDYQNAPYGGDGYLRFLSFHPASETLCVVTYSPYTKDYNFFDKKEDSFIESIKLLD
jgi:predicted MPP superfamily phosphohydrolase